MKHTPKPDGSRWQPIETAPKDGTFVLLWLGEPWSRPEKARWYEPWGNWHMGSVPVDPAREEFHGIGASLPTHWMPLPSTPLPDPEPEEPKPPKELWVNVYRIEQWLNATLNERLADQMARDPRNRLTGHAIRYVLPDEAERGFSEEEIKLAAMAINPLLWAGLNSMPTALEPAKLARAALSAISQHRSKKPS